MSESDLLGLASMEQIDETEIAEIVDVADVSLPEKSSALYLSRYNKFIEWCNNKNITDYTEEVLLDFFTEMADKYNIKASSCCAQYSMIKPFLFIKHGIDISKYEKLRTYLNNNNMNYKPKKHIVFTRDEINKFLRYAPDEKYLAIKVVVIFGIYGECQKEDLVRMKSIDIQDLGSILYVKLWDKSKTFTIDDEFYLQIYRKYAALRPTDSTENRFFVQYLNGKCSRRVIGVNNFSGFTRQVAMYLKLKNWKEYNFQSLKKFSSSMHGTQAKTRRSVNLSLNTQETDFSKSILNNSINDSNDDTGNCSEEEPLFKMNSIKTETPDLWEEESYIDNSNGETSNDFTEEPSETMDSAEMSYNNEIDKSSKLPNLDIDFYFKYVSESVKRFPLKRQAEIKMKIGNIIFKEEMEYLSLQNDAT